MKVRAQHSEIADLAKRHALSIVGMDANETVTREGRMQLRTGEPMTFSGTTRGCGMSASHMSAYVGTVVDPFEHAARGRASKP